MIIKIVNKGDIFGRLKIIERVGSNNGNKVYKCKCECGNIKNIRIDHLRSGRIKSCGCYSRENLKNIHSIHGMSIGNRFYKIYMGIKIRCNNNKEKTYKNYGGRGIKCEWNRFEEFKNDMYENYLEHEKLHGTKNTTIERINVNGNYCKENCKFETIIGQANNKRNTIIVYYKGKKQALSLLCRKLNLVYKPIFRIIKNNNISIINNIIENPKKRPKYIIS